MPLGKTQNDINIAVLVGNCSKTWLLYKHKRGGFIKRYGNIYHKIYDYENLLIAHKNARKNKTFYSEVKEVDSNIDYYLILLQNMLIWRTYKTSKYEIFNIIDKGKEREIYKLPYFPDRICQWAIMLQTEHIFLETFTHFSCASIPRRGIHYALQLLNRYMKDEKGSKYCLKIDIKKFFPNVDHAILKMMLRKKFKDPDLLWLLDEIIDSVDGDKGLPIGNYTSQYLANFYLTYFDHWLKQEMGVKYAIRYMDDIVILSESKAWLHQLRKEIGKYLITNLKLEIKDNWQVFPSRVRGVDFVGYRHFGNYILLRKSTATRLKRKMRGIKTKLDSGGNLTYSDWCSINSYKGWLKWCNSYNLYKKYIKPLEPYCEEYYQEKIKKVV